LKAESRVVSLVYSTKTGQWLDETLAGTVRIECDIRDHLSLRRILARHEIDEVYHTAAISIVKTAHLDPIGVFDVNIMGTVNLLEASRQVNVKRILVLNTDKVYGEGLNASEDQHYLPTEPYATSKCCQGFVVQSFIETYGMNIAMSHSCNVFGYDPYSNRIFPNVVKKCLQGQSPLIFTNDESIREYIFIEDLLDAFERLMTEDGHVGARNISTGWIFNQKDIVLKILEHFPELEPIYAEGDIPLQINKQSLTSNRWDWKPKWSFDDSVAETIKKFSKYHLDWK
jgi:CDP-glucose 4,6-dehydratase